ncbi:MAG TPA: hypothetical protein VFN88_03000, partial [Caulobacteraceae bacterium]|nr:hypothetical protein [Caulobacteraceae bacterium]
MADYPAAGGEALLISRRLGPASALAPFFPEFSQIRRQGGGRQYQAVLTSEADAQAVRQAAAKAADRQGATVRFLCDGLLRSVDPTAAAVSLLCTTRPAKQVLAEDLEAHAAWTDAALLSRARNLLDFKLEHGLSRINGLSSPPRLARQGPIVLVVDRT